MKIDVAFSLGSNSGDRVHQVTEARNRLIATPGVEGFEYSVLYETEPVGVREQYRHINFMNAIVLVHTSATPQCWMERAREIEAQLGRVRGEDRYAPRTIDIDLIYAGAYALDGDSMKVPHPCWMDRRFVLQPLADLRPDLVLPGSVLSVSEALAALPPEPRIWPADPQWPSPV